MHSRSPGECKIRETLRVGAGAVKKDWCIVNLECSDMRQGFQTGL